MERLTKYHNGVNTYIGPGCKYQDTGEIPKEMEISGVRVVLQRLAEYEETELTPEEAITLKSIKSWADAVEREYLKFVELEKDRRLITLPCKVTDTVYILETVYKGKKVIGEQVVPAQIDRVIIGGTTGTPVYDLCSETGKWYKSMNPGEDFYLTAEEAEKAVKEGPGNDG